MSMMVNSYVNHVESIANFVANNGGTEPRLGQVIFPSALYDSSADITWTAWESWNGTNRVPSVAGLNHATGYFTDIEEVGLNPLVDDGHGPPAICLDDEGYLHAFYGNHNTDQLHSSTQWAVDGSPGPGSMWAVRDPIAGFYTYPHPVAVGSDIYLFVRRYVSASSKYPLYLRKTATLAAGIATWNAEVALVDFGSSTRFYMGNALANGTDIWIVATKGAEPDTAREHVYLFVYDTATGAVKNHDNSFSVASGSLPVTASDADTNYRLFTHSGGNNDGGAPSLCFDSSGDPHVLFKDGTTGTFAVKHIKRSSGTWSSPASIATVANRFTCPTLVPLSGGRVEAWYVVGPNRFGDMARIERSAAGTWGPEITVVSEGSDGLGNPSAVLNGQSDARVVFCEAVDSELDSAAGNLRDYLYGDGGLVAYEQEPEAPTTPDTLQLNAENLQLNGEDLTLGV